MRRGFNVLFILLVANWVMLPISAQDASQKIVYLAFEWVDNQPKLKDFEIVPGHLKQGYGRVLPGQHLQCTMLDASNKQIFQTSLPQPGEIVAELPDKSGLLRRVPVAPIQADFYLRVPYHPGPHTIQLSQMEPSSEGHTLRKHPLVSLYINFDENKGGNDE